MLDRLLAWLSPHWRSLILRNTQRLLDSLTALRRREIILSSVVWTAIVWGLGVVINYAVQRAFGVDSWIAAMTLRSFGAPP